LRIAATAGHLKISADTVTSKFGPSHDGYDLNLSGGETVIPEGPTISFQRIDDSSFDIIVSVNNKKFGNHVGENRFEFSADGKMLTETKTHTEREVVPEGTDQTKSTMIRISTSVLVFHRDPDSR